MLAHVVVFAQLALGTRIAFERTLMAAKENATESSGGHQCHVVVENDTPYEIEHIVVIHKHSSVKPPTHALVWEDVRPGSTTSVEVLETKVGHGSFGHQDWWLVTWRFKRSSDSGCPLCQKEDGTCETYVTEPDNFFSQLFLDPMTYVKGAVLATNIAVSAATLGTATVLGASLGGLVTKVAASHMLNIAETAGFKDSAISYDDVKNSLDSGIPLKIVISHVPPPTRPLVKLNFFKLGRPNEIRKTSHMTSNAMPCLPEPIDENKRPPDDVLVRVKNIGSARIKTLTLVHKFNALRPRVQLREWPSVDLEPGQTSSMQMISTVTGFSFRNDWWMIAWQEDSGSSDPLEECLVKSAMSGLKWYDVAKLGTEDVVLGAISAFGGDTVGNLANIAQHVNEHRRGHGNFSVSSRVEALLGREVLQNLANDDSTEGLTKCNVSPHDVDAVPGGQVELPAGMDADAIFRFHEQACHAKVLPLRCLPSKACSELRACQELG